MRGAQELDGAERQLLPEEIFHSDPFYDSKEENCVNIFSQCFLLAWAERLFSLVIEMGGVRLMNINRSFRVLHLRFVVSRK